jgi:hypothetical protein
VAGGSHGFHGRTRQNIHRACKLVLMNVLVHHGMMPRYQTSIPYVAMNVLVHHGMMPRYAVGNGFGYHVRY